MEITGLNHTKTPVLNKNFPAARVIGINYTYNTPQKAILFILYRKTLPSIDDLVETHFNLFAFADYFSSHNGQIQPILVETDDLNALINFESIDSFQSVYVNANADNIFKDFPDDHPFKPRNFTINGKYSRIFFDEIYYTGGKIRLEGNIIAERTSTGELNIVDPLTNYLISTGIPEKRAFEIALGFSLTSCPELDVLSAAQLLRTQLNRATGRDLTISKNPYPGRRAGVSPVSFLRIEYASELSAGTLGPGQIRMADQTLYAALRDATGDAQEMKDEFPTGEQPASVGEIIARLSARDKTASPEARASAFATILDTDAETALKFVTRYRPERAKGKDDRVR